MSLYVQWMANRIHQGRTIKVRLANHVLWLRKIQVDDLLSVSLYPEIFPVEKNKEQDLANDIFNMASSSEDNSKLELRKLVYKCMVKFKGDMRTIPRALKDDEVIEDLYRKLLWFSMSKIRIDRVLKSKLRDIYNLYKDKNYAIEYYGNGYLNKLEELSFNMAVHAEGIKQMKQTQKNNDGAS